MLMALSTQTRSRDGLPQTAVAARGACSPLDALLFCYALPAVQAAVMPLANPQFQTWFALMCARRAIVAYERRLTSAPLGARRETVRTCVRRVMAATCSVARTDCNASGCNGWRCTAGRPRTTHPRVIDQILDQQQPAEPCQALTARAIPQT